MHAPRGNLEFYADPESPFHKPEFATDKRLVLHCGGGWRSALGALSLMNMGFTNVSHLAGGFSAWKKAGGAVEPVRGTRVTGLGGVFFKAQDPPALLAWYRRHLGIEAAEWGHVFLWHEQAGTGYTVWSPFKADSTYFEPSSKPFMLNFRVADLEALLAELRGAGVTVVGEVKQEPNGKFGWVMDPEGNKLELWEPVPSDKDPYLGN